MSADTPKPFMPGDLIDLRPQLAVEQALAIFEKLDDIFQGLSLGDALAILAYRYGALIHGVHKRLPAAAMQAQLHFLEVTQFAIKECQEEGNYVEPVTAEEFAERVEQGRTKPANIPPLDKGKVN